MIAETMLRPATQGAIQDEEQGADRARSLTRGQCMQVAKGVMAQLAGFCFQQTMSTLGEYMAMRLEDQGDSELQRFLGRTAGSLVGAVPAAFFQAYSMQRMLTAATPGTNVSLWSLAGPSLVVTVCGTAGQVASFYATRAMDRAGDSMALMQLANIAISAGSQVR